MGRRSSGRVRLLALLALSIVLVSTVAACTGRRLDGRYTLALWGSSFYDFYDDRVEFFLYDSHRWTGSYEIDGDRINICRTQRDCDVFTTDTDFQCFEHIGHGEYCRFADRQP